MNIPQQEHERWMRHALRLTQFALEIDEVPVGAVVTVDNEIVGEGFNRTITNCDPTAHAEIIALRNAAFRLGNHRMPAANLYVTIEPCAMCAGAIVQARLSTVVYGAADIKSGAAGSVINVLDNNHLNHRCDVIPAVLEDDCRVVIQNYFRKKRVKPARKDKSILQVSR